MVSAPFTTHITNTVTSIKVSRPFHATQGKSSFDRPGKFTPPGIDSFRERLHVEGISEDQLLLSQVQENKVQTLITNQSGVSGIVGVLRDRLISSTIL